MFQLRNRLPFGATLALVVGLLLFGAGCKVRKPRQGDEAAQSAARIGERADALHLAQVASELAAPIASKEGWESLKATVRGRIVLGGGKEFSSRINLHALRGKGLRLSIQPFPLIEAARLWFSPQSVVVVDLINGVYTEVSYMELGGRLGFTPSYDQIESLILGQIFTPSGGAVLDLLDRLTIKQGADGSLSLGQRDARGAYELSLSPKTRQPMSFSLRDRQGHVRFSSQYGGAQPLGEQTLLPRTTSLYIFAPEGDRAKELGGLELEFQKIGAGSADPSLITPTIKPNYERLSLEQVLKVLESL